MAIYETMLILDTQNEPQTIEDEIDRIVGFVESNGGSMHLVEKVGRRRLAYEIAGRSDGYYAVLYYETDPAQIAPLQRILKLSEPVLRHMVLRREKLPTGPMMTPGEPLRPRTEEAAPSASPAASVATAASEAPKEESAVETKTETEPETVSDSQSQAEVQPAEKEASPVEPAGEAEEEAEKSE